MDADLMRPAGLDAHLHECRSTPVLYGADVAPCGLPLVMEGSDGAEVWVRHATDGLVHGYIPPLGLALDEAEIGSLHGAALPRFGEVTACTSMSREQGHPRSPTTEPVKRGSGRIVRCHQPEERSFQKPSAGHGRQPPRLGYGENIGVLIENGKARWRRRLVPRRSVPREHLPRRKPSSGSDDLPVETNPPVGDPPAPRAWRRVPIPPGEVVQYAETRGRAIEALLVPVTAVEHELDRGGTQPPFASGARRAPAVCRMLPYAVRHIIRGLRSGFLPNHVSDPRFLVAAALDASKDPVALAGLSVGPFPQNVDVAKPGFFHQLAQLR